MPSNISIFPLVRRHGRAMVFWFLLVPTRILAGSLSGPPSNGDIVLGEGWTFQSSELVKEAGQIISTSSFSPSRWYTTSVPTTVLAALVKSNVYSDIWMGDNLSRIPSAQFTRPWWFRKQFAIPDDPDRHSVTLAFDGIIYRANIWLNGKMIASADTTAGVYRRFEFDVSSAAHFGGTNVLAVEVFPPVAGEPSVGFVDWNPRPPDASMGIWRKVRVRCTGPIAINSPFVKTELDEKTLTEARLTVSAEIHNASKTDIVGTLHGKIGAVDFESMVHLAPAETKFVEFEPGEFPQLQITNPRIWWTHDTGKPELYTMHLEFIAGTSVSDARDVRFGIRRVSDSIDKAGHRGYKLNGQRILIRGGGWTDNLLLDQFLPRIKAQLEYVRHMRLNAIRMEGFWGDDEVFDLCDEMGILVMPGYSCQWEWDEYLGKKTDRRYGGITSNDDVALVSKMWKDQVIWLRNHPSIFVWVYASDLLPLPGLERKYLDILRTSDGTRPSLASAGGSRSQVTGPTGVKILGPYEYVPPVYWYVDSTKGGAYGFNTETGPGAEVPPLESIVRMIPADSLWPQSASWNYHCGRNEFGTLRRYNNAMDNRLGKPSTLEEYEAKAQYLNYEGMRAMFEAFSVNRYRATGIIQWMLNAAWPKMFWQLYDFYLLPNGAFYGVKTACRPINIQYNYGDNSVSLVNNTLVETTGLTAEVKILDVDLSEKFSASFTATLQPDQILRLLTIPEIAGLSTTYFLDARLYDRGRQLVSANFYALSTRSDILLVPDTSAESWFTTPVRQFADLTQLNDLRKTTIREQHQFTRSGTGGTVSVNLENSGHALAFCIELMLKSGGQPVVPIFIDDNYLTLLPGERRTVVAQFPWPDSTAAEPRIQLRGWNLQH